VLDKLSDALRRQAARQTFGDARFTVVDLRFILLWYNCAGGRGVGEGDQTRGTRPTATTTKTKRPSATLSVDIVVTFVTVIHLRTDLRTIDASHSLALSPHPISYIIGSVCFVLRYCWAYAFLACFLLVVLCLVVTDWKNSSAK